MGEEVAKHEHSLRTGFVALAACTLFLIVAFALCELLAFYLGDRTGTVVLFHPLLAVAAPWLVFRWWGSKLMLTAPIVFAMIGGVLSYANYAWLYFGIGEWLGLLDVGLMSATASWYGLLALTSIVVGGLSGTIMAAIRTKRA